MLTMLCNVYFYEFLNIFIVPLKAIVAFMFIKRYENTYVVNSNMQKKLYQQSDSTLKMQVEYELQTKWTSKKAYGPFHRMMEGADVVKQLNN